MDKGKGTVSRGGAENAENGEMREVLHFPVPDLRLEIPQALRLGSSKALPLSAISASPRDKFLSDIPRVGSDLLTGCQWYSWRVRT